MPDAENRIRELSATTVQDRITPPDLQLNPSLARAVEPARFDRTVDSIAARGDVPASRVAGAEDVSPPEETTDTSIDVPSAEDQLRKANADVASKTVTDKQAAGHANAAVDLQSDTVTADNTPAAADKPAANKAAADKKG